MFTLESRLEISEDLPFEAVAAQLQQNLEARDGSGAPILYVVDGTTLNFLGSEDNLSYVLRYSYKQQRHVSRLTEYYFRDCRSDVLLCFFGRRAASLVFPGLNSVDPPSTSGPATLTTSITDRDVTYKFSDRRDGLVQITDLGG